MSYRVPSIQSVSKAEKRAGYTAEPQDDQEPAASGAEREHKGGGVKIITSEEVEVGSRRRVCSKEILWLLNLSGFRFVRFYVSQFTYRLSVLCVEYYLPL